MTSPSLSQTATRKFTIASWTGDVQAVGKIVEICSDLQADALRTLDQAFAASTDARKEAYLADYAGGTSELRVRFWEEHNRRLKETYARAMAMEMTASERKWSQEYRGEPEDVLQLIDPTDVVRLSIKLGRAYSPTISEGYALRVTMDRKFGVEVEAIAPTTGWVARAEGQLRTLLVGRRPWYSVLRNQYLLALIVFVPLLVISSVFMAEWLGSSSKPTTGEFLGSAFVFGVVSALVASLLTARIRNWLPAFELTPPGGRASGARKIALVGGVVAWLLASIVIPLLMLH